MSSFSYRQQRPGSEGFNKTNLSTVQDMNTLEDMEMDDVNPLPPIGEQEPFSPQQQQQQQFGQGSGQMQQLNVMQVQPWFRRHLAENWEIYITYYLSKLRRDSVGADFQSVRKLTNYIYAKPLESRLSHIYNVYYALQQYPHYRGYGY